MAGADYRLCDKCRGKAFYDATLNYHHAGTEKEAFRCAGQLTNLNLGRLGDWAVLCSECAKTHKCIIVEL